MPITLVTQLLGNKMRLDGRTLPRGRYLSVGVSCNWSITMKYIPNDQWMVGLLAWCHTYWSWFTGCGCTITALTMQWMSRASWFILQLRLKQLSMMSFARVLKA
jgi:hypothetical protein